MSYLNPTAFAFPLIEPDCSEPVGLSDSRDRVSATREQNRAEFDPNRTSLSSNSRARCEG